MEDVLARWRVVPGAPSSLREADAGDRSGVPDRAELKAASDALVRRLADLQARLWAEHRRSLLLVLQALDAGGKDGTVRKVFTGVNPQGVTVRSFREPNAEEREHDFLWRIHRHVPPAGWIGVFNRSHYEDVLVARVEGIVPEPVWRERYELIRGFEQNLVAAGTTIVKVYLNISREEQAERFRARLARPDKRWKFSKGDLVVHERWDDYIDAYDDAIRETATATAPWFVVPADDKKARNWIVLQILVATLEAMDPRYPEPDEDLDGIVI